MRGSYPELADRLASEKRTALLALLERRKAVACRDRTAALLTIADAVIARYQARKDRRGLLDYDDLIDKTLALLGEDRAAWVHYKLDHGIDHVLIDEAQDTSPKQWEIIRRLTAEFFAGAGARAGQAHDLRGRRREAVDLLVPGRGAARVRRDAAHLREAHARRSSCDLPVRTASAIRSAPARTCSAPSTRCSSGRRPIAGLSADNGHDRARMRCRRRAPGLVEIWDTLKPDDKREIEAWDAPFDELTETSPQVRLAAKIARQRQARRHGKQGPRAGDVLVLVRQRGPLFEAIIRALKDAAVAVAGADRLVLTEHIAVMDLMVLADALLLPDDDLALATVLKSPLFGLDDDDLFEIAWQRKSSLRAALRRRRTATRASPTRPTSSTASRDWARQDTPFGFYARVLGAERGRQRFLARLGHEADDALDEFLNLALDYERRETPSLQGFVAWLRTARTDVKRDMEITRDEVRVMTVHGAKGLEAPIVILADTTTPPAGPPQRQPRLLVWPTVARHPGRFVWAGPKATTWRRSRRRASAPARDRGRVSAAALRGDDARHRPAGRVRGRGRAQPARRLLVQPRRAMPRSRSRSRNRPTTATASVWRYRPTRRRRPCDDAVSRRYVTP